MGLELPERPCTPPDLNFLATWSNFDKRPTTTQRKPRDLKTGQFFKNRASSVSDAQPPRPTFLTKAAQRAAMSRSHGRNAATAKKNVRSNYG